MRLFGTCTKHGCYLVMATIYVVPNAGFSRARIYTTSCMRIEISCSNSSLGGVLTPEGVEVPLDVIAISLGLITPLRRPAVGVAKPLGGAAALGPSGDPGTMSGGTSGILIRLA